MRILSLLLALIFCTVACQNKHDHKGKTPLVEVDDQFLYQEDLQRVLPNGLSKEDSLLFAEHYIRNWVEDVLLYDQAQRNIPDNVEVIKLVENYRKALITHAYQQELIAQRLEKEIPETDVAAYYEKNKALFKLERPLIKGLFIKVPVKSPQLNSVRRWYKDQSREAVEHLEKYSLQNAVRYEYFYDKWVSADDVVDMLPLRSTESDLFLSKNRHIELKDSAYCYFLNVIEFRPVGEEKPYELAHGEIKELLINQRQVDFMKEVRGELYQKALKRKKVIYNY